MNVLETIKDFICDIVTAVQNFFEEEVVFTKKTFILITALCTAIGLIGGFLVSPIKKGIYFNISNNGNNNNGNNSEPDDEE